ncbi:MAG: hypothetical protein M5U01_21835 [Ardenticatenaceae bacterium]|nr:hypothetical protein [Ardenticatenaceae bacterium]HBY97724.1 hypothetical protein [Chloroflexota bacterium]
MSQLPASPAAASEFVGLFKDTLMPPYYMAAPKAAAYEMAVVVAQMELTIQSSVNWPMLLAQSMLAKVLDELIG